MKRIKIIAYLALLAVVLSSCKAGAGEMSTEEILSSLIQAEQDGVHDDERAEAAEHGYPMWTEDHVVEGNGASYRLRVFLSDQEKVQLVGITSAREAVTVPVDFEGFAPVTHVSMDAVELPNTKQLTFSEGIAEIAFYEASYPALEVLELPSTMERFSAFSQAAWNMMDEWQTLVPALREIRVAEGNAAWWDEDGMLYANDFVSLDANTGAYPQKQLICLPRNYQNTQQVGVPMENNNLKQVNIPDGTDYIHTGAVYHCYGFDRLMIPDSVTRIAPAAIVATAEHPLVIVCHKGSAAAGYVEQFGARYHLTVTYISD